MIKGIQVRKAVVAAIAAITAFAVLAPFAPGASAASNYTQTRYAGQDRFDTAALIASAIAEATPTAVLARADIFPDALTGAFAAAANNDGPLLLTRSDSVPDRTMQALQAEGVQNVILLGGTAAIDSSVEAQLRAAGYNVSRIAGSNRYRTAIEIAEQGAPIIGTIDGQRAALLSNGLNFPDALAGAPLSFAAGLPSLLTPPNLQNSASDVAVFNEVVDAMNRLNINHVYLLGGPAAVSQGIEDELRNRGFGVTRLAGGNRSATSVEIFEFGLDKGIYTNRRFGLARGDKFPDALAYAPLAGRPRTSPAPQSGVADTGGQANGLLLAASHCTLSTEVENFIRAHNATWTEGEILGGPAAICEEVAQQVRAAATTEPTDPPAQADVALSPTSGETGSQVTVTYTGDRPANITDVSSNNCTITNEGSQSNNRTVTVSGAEGTQCTITTTVTFTDAQGGTQTFTDTFTVTAPAANVTLNPTEGPSGTQVTAAYTGDRPANITDVSSTNCTITNEGTQNQNRTFTVTGTQGTQCTITTTVTYTDAQGGTDTFTDTFTITAPEGQATATVRPELRTASIGATTSAGTLVTYCFDEEVTGTTGPQVGNFHVYTADGDTQYDATGTTTITGDTNNCVQVNFADITTASNLVSNLTLATVDFGAVMDNEGSLNPIGDAPIGSGQQVTLVAGETAAPDLLSVTDCAPEPTGAGADTDARPETRCTFTFDEPAFTVTPAGFHLVLTSGEQINCVALAGPEGGTSTSGADTASDTTIVAECEQTAASGPIATGAVARGFVDANTVSDAAADQATRADNNQAAGNFTATEGCDVAQDDAPVVGPACVGNLNPLQATDNPDLSTPAPDLVTATLGAETTANDTIIYDFDETVQTTLTNASFCYYVASGDQTCGTGTAARGDQTGTGDDSTVVVTFAEGTLNQAVGASVLGGAVRDVNGVANEEDEEGMANANQSATQAGRTDNPDLIGVALQTSPTAPTFSAIYAFDEDVDQNALTGSEATLATAGRFFLVAADGTRYVATACETRTAGEGTPAGTEDTDHTVRCTAYAVANDNGTATTVTPTNNALTQAVLGTVDDGAVSEEVGTGTNPEGAELTTGGTGTPTA